MNKLKKDKHYINMSIMLQMLIMTFEAESIAYTICQHYGLDSSDYSFSYVAGWSSGKETKELKASLERIRSASDEMITGIDKALEKQTKREQSRTVRDEAR